MAISKLSKNVAIFGQILALTQDLVTTQSGLNPAANEFATGSNTTIFREVKVLPTQEILAQLGAKWELPAPHTQEELAKQRQDDLTKKAIEDNERASTDDGKDPAQEIEDATVVMAREEERKQVDERAKKHEDRMQADDHERLSQDAQDKLRRDGDEQANLSADHAEQAAKQDKEIATLRERLSERYKDAPDAVQATHLEKFDAATEAVKAARDDRQATEMRELVEKQSRKQASLTHEDPTRQ
jgi:hypothetical protein